MSVKKVAVLEEFTWQLPVKDKDLSTPPGSPAKGDRYIIAATGSGAWVSQTGNIALCTVGGGSPSWEFVTKVEGMICWVEDENLFYRCDGTNWGLLDFVKNDGTVNPTNLLYNGDFENWSAGLSSAPDYWNLTGSGASVARESTIIKLGFYAAKITRSGADCALYASFHIPKGINYWKGRKVTFGCWVYATVASRARLGIYDDVTGWTYSSYHTGGSSWEWLTVTATVNASATTSQLRCSVITGDTSAYFDGATFIEGESSFAFSQKPLEVDNLSSIFKNINPANLLYNGDFECWGLGSSSVPDGWISSGAPAVAREASTIKTGLYSFKQTGTTVKYTYQIVSVPRGISYWKSRKITFGCWVWCAAANLARISLFDDDWNYSDYHTGNSTWQWLTVTRTITTGAANVYCILLTATDSSPAYFDGAMCVEGESCFAFSPKFAEEGIWSDITDLAIPNNTLQGWSAFTSRSVYYAKIGKAVFIAGDINGTSNATGSGINLPFGASSYPTVGLYLPAIGYVVDNGVAQTNTGMIYVGPGASTAGLYKTIAAGVWTASGSKRTIFAFWYWTVV